ncbi:MAG: UDP-N-acetylmuramate:L-alanyl-gamma-D-glutamyl-meso-diaminopimelate ligase [Gammaproteobacteria bacterium]|nr:UDP-N-acetylmuramate:L-alanyl-gamma-D-glutamyl-meso-diaminopimelate ligase [Gammaproteobacteria bacterium]
MHIHILGICGTFMGGIALLARQLGYEVSGSDANVYPPMSTQLASQGIVLSDGYDTAALDPAPDLVVIGNAMSRGNPMVEYVLDRNLPYLSGPAFLAQYILRDRWVLGVAGTHGKTTTASMVAWILEYAKLKPGFLIGGIPKNFGISARLGDAPFFVVEADEYDSAFFDKRSKFIHYQSRTLILNNLEFDHADIFDDLDAIKRQFHHLVRTVPQNGLIVAPSDDDNIKDVLDQGCWTPIEECSAPSGWEARNLSEDGASFDVHFKGKKQGRVEWELMGQHNINNALAAIAAGRHAGVMVQHAIDALGEFQNVKRRMEKRGEVSGVHIYDDFAHHPTAITMTLEGLRRQVGSERIIAILEPRSNTMQMGVHKETLAAAFAAADEVVLFQPGNSQCSMQTIAAQIGSHAQVFDDVGAIVTQVTHEATAGTHLLVMSNGAFGGIHQKLIDALEEK